MSYDIKVLGDKILGDLGEPVVSVTAASDGAKNDFYLVGSDVIVGLALGPPPSKPGAKKPVLTVDPKKIAKPPKAKFSYAGAAKVATRSVARAKKVGEAAVRSAKTYKPAKAVAIPQPKTKVKGLVDTVLGGVYDILGATPSARAKSAQDKYLAANKKHASAAMKADQAGKKAVAVAVAAAKTIAPAVAKIQKLRGGKGVKTTVLGLDNGNWELVDEHEASSIEEVIGSFWTDIVGQEGEAPPYDPRFDGPVDPGAAPVVDEGGTTEDTAYDIDPVPAGGGNLSKEEAWEPFRKVPGDGVVYDGYKGWPRYMVASYAYFYGRKFDDHGAKQDGYVWGWSQMRGIHDQTPRWIRVYWTQWKMKEDAWEEAPGRSMSPEDVSAVSDQSIRGGDGPLIGNPESPEWKNLQWATEDKKWFWQAKNAPSWATAEARAAAELLKKETEKANRAAADAETARQAKIKAEMDEAWAKQDLELALAEARAESEGKIASQRQATEQAQADIERGKTDSERALEEAKAAREWQSFQMEQMRSGAVPYDGGGGSGYGDEAALAEGRDPFGDPGQGDPELEAQAALEPPPEEVPYDESEEGGW